MRKYADILGQFKQINVGKSGKRTKRSAKEKVNFIRKTPSVRSPPFRPSSRPHVSSDRHLQFDVITRLVVKEEELEQVCINLPRNPNPQQSACKSLE
jgi:hypothetical protein